MGIKHMSKDLDAILQFIQQPNTDYAYMLTGAWGSGKTYFWKHIVVPRLQEQANSGDLIAYVSLYGLEKAEEIRSAVFTQLHPRLAKAGKYASMLAPMLGGLLGVQSPESEKVSEVLSGFVGRLDNGKQLIICFDDLERTPMPIEIRFGQINQFVEHAGAKVVILCNEREIKENHRPTYEKTKEKIIRITRAFSCDPMTALPAIVAEFAADPAYHDFLTANHDLIADILNQSGLKNLRALKYAMLVLQTAYGGLLRASQTDTAVIRDYLRILFAITLDLQEFEIGAADARSFLTEGNMAIFMAYAKKGDEEKNSLAAFGERYGFSGLETNLPTSVAFVELIETGYLDFEKLRAEIDVRKTAKTSGKQAVDAIIGGWFTLPNDAIRRTVSAALEAVRNGEVKTPQRLHNLANALDWMSREGVAGIMDGTAQSAFGEGISNPSMDWTTIEREMLFLKHSPHPGEQETELGKYVREEILNADLAFRDSKLKEDFNEAFNALGEDPEYFSDFLRNEQGKGIGSHPIASFISPTSLSDALFSATNEARFAISGAFRLRYSERYKVERLAKDLAWLQEFTISSCVIWRG